jgi:hypothetical protein
MLLKALACSLFSMAALATAPKGWVAVGDDAFTPSQIECAAMKSPEWRVLSDKTTKNYRVVRHHPETRFNRRFQQYLVEAVNHGEFGGSVVVKDLAGNRLHTWDDVNPVAIESLADELIVIEGLAHLTSNTGRVWRLSRSATGWQRIVVIELPTAPLSATQQEAGRLLIATSGGLVRVNLLNTKAIELVYENLSWGQLHPNSVVASGADVFVGMRSGVVHIDEAINATMYRPKYCQRFSVDSCRCLGARLTSWKRDNFPVFGRYEDLQTRQLEYLNRPGFGGGCLVRVA